MSTTIIALFHTHDGAQRSVQELLDHAFPRDHISLVARSTPADECPDEAMPDTGDRLVEGAGVGAAIGGIGGLLLGLAALAIPGVGPVVAAGPIVAALGGAGIGAITGGLIGTLTGIGVPEAHAAHYAEALRRGDILVLVKSDAAKAGMAARILYRHGAVDVEKRTVRRDMPTRDSATAAGKPREPNAARAMTPSLASTLSADADLTSSTVTESLPPHLHDKLDDVPLHSAEHGTSSAPGIIITDEQMERLYKVLSNPPREATDHEADFRNNFQARYSKQGLTFEQLVPAYRYGYHLGLNSHYRDKKWAQAEPQARAEWENRHRGSWEQYKDAVRYGWNCAHESGNRPG